MACSTTYTAVPGDAGVVAKFGQPITLTATSGDFGPLPGEVFLKCADGTLTPFKSVQQPWLPNTIVATLPNQPTGCTGPYAVVVRIVAPPADCEHVIAVDSLPGLPPGTSLQERLVHEILATTTINSEPATPKAGEPLLITVIPGAALSPDTAALPIPVATSFSVRYSVSRADKDGKPVPLKDHEYGKQPQTAGALPGSDALKEKIQLPPPFIDELTPSRIAQFWVSIAITVSIDGHEASGTRNLPVAVLAIPVPGILVLSTDAGHVGELFAMVRSGSQFTSVDAVVTQLNAVIQAVDSVKDLVGFVTFFTGLQQVFNVLSAGGVAGFATGKADELDDHHDFDDEASSLLLIGPPGITVKLHSMGDQDGETSTFTAPAVSAAGLADFPLGFLAVDNFGPLKWDTDSGQDLNDDSESVEFA